ncbi:MAG: methyl-accepting chemotaxis protein [Desulfovibrionales bacterium]|nr:methyl-accepting chemotaxis protein [Desulfovibrionales bacterium]
MQFKSLKVKLLILLSGCFVLFIGALLVVTIHFTSTAAIENARTIAQKVSKEQALLVREKFDAGFNVARTLANTLTASKKSDSPLNRQQVLDIMYNIGKENSELYGVWLGWEPNVFDGRDSEYTSQKTYSSSEGRFIPYWSKIDGVLTLSPCTDFDDAWYQFAFRTQEEYATTVTQYSTPSGFVYSVTSLAIPLVVNGKSLGVVGVDLSADFLKDIVNDIDVFKGQCSMGLIASDGTLQAATDAPDILGTPYSEVVKNGNELFKRAQSGTTVIAETDETLRVLIPFSFGNVKKNWVVALSIPMSIVLEQANEMTKTLLVTGILGLLLALGGLYYLVRLISNPIIDTSRVISSIAEGDLTVRCVSRGQDEIATMQEAVNTMAATLQTNMQELETNMEEVRVRSKEAEVATEKAVQAEADAIKAHREGQLAAAKQLEVLVADLTQVSSELDMHVKTTSEGVGQQDVRNSETATAMEEMNSTILEVAKNAGEAAASVDTVYTEAQSGIKVIDQSVSTITNVHKLSEHLTLEMGNLGTQVESISEILNVISDIADQTNLLALNAAIEAARAGDAGRGFAVVADEVRKLAENTMEATNKVGTAIQNIQAGTQQNIDAMTKTATAVDEATKYVSESGEAFERIVSKVTPATDQVRAIATAAEQQSSASEEITHAIEEISHISSITASKMTEAEHAVETLGKVSDSLRHMMHTLQQG